MKNTYYLPLDSFHIIPIKHLHPDEIKKSTKLAILDREKTSRTGLLNAVSRALGFVGGFSDYKEKYEIELLPFLKQHNLKKKVDLIETRDPITSELSSLKRQDLSERLFFSNTDLPKKVFTGYNSNFIENLSNSKYEALNFNKRIHYLENKSICNMSFCEYLDAMFTNRHCDIEGLFEEICNNIDIALYDDFFHSEQNVITKETNEIEIDNSDMFSTILLGALYKNNILDFALYISFLNDNLFIPQKQDPEIERFNIEDNMKGKYNHIFDFFRMFLNKEKDGWIEIIPFNENLIFLKHHNGDYDFIFKNQRHRIFDHQIYGDHITTKNTPSFISDYHFERWLYFNYKGFRYLDIQNSEIMYYTKNTNARNYPGSKQILLEYYESMGVYNKKDVIVTHNTQLDGFKPVFISNATYMISELITIGEFNLFLDDNPTYLNDFKKNEFLEANNQGDRFPVCISWYDTLNYISWFNTKNDVDSKLLNIDEFSKIRGINDITIDFDKKIAPHEIMLICNKTNRWTPHRDSYNIQLHFISKLINIEKWTEPNSQLKFMRSNYFAEWLAEKTCVRTGKINNFFYSLQSGYDTLIRPKPPLDCNGLYKGLKIGFRLMYKFNLST